MAYSYGGDTDTIGSMSGAIAGAFCGLGGIPSYMVKQCEGVEKAKKQADQLYEIYMKRASGPSEEASPTKKMKNSTSPAKDVQT